MAALWLTAWALAGVDGQGLQATDGARFPALMDADLGIENTLAASITMHASRRSVVLRTREGDRVLLEAVTTQDLMLSMNLFDAVRVGMSFPRHRPVDFDGQRLDGALAGDLAFWIQSPLWIRERVRLAVTAQVDFPLGAQSVWLGETDPALDARVAGEWEQGRFRWLLNLGPRLTRAVDVPGMKWGNHWTWGAGLRWEPYGPLGFTGELFGHVPLNPISGAPGNYPVEFLATVDARLGPVTVGFGGGRGLTRGLSSPSSRLLGRVDVRPHAKSDRDGDGIGDVLDVCPGRAEDFDHHRDQDGCPESDNDLDGLLDPVDACPDEPETQNGWKDRDGCPDIPASVVLTVGPGDRGDAVVRIGDQGFSLVAGGELLARVDAGSVPVRIEALGFATWEEPVLLEGREETPMHVELERLDVVTLHLRVTDAAGVGLIAKLDGRTVPEEGLDVERPVGLWEGMVVSPGFFPSALSVDLTVDSTSHTVVLLRASLDGGLAFEVDSDELSEPALEQLEGILAYILDHPEIQLLRIEGAADAQGTSQYNYTLSLARAERVLAWLVEQGIERERLLAIGSGEATTARRQVGFRPLVWEQ